MDEAVNYLLITHLEELAAGLRQQDERASDYKLSQTAGLIVMHAWHAGYEARKRVEESLKEPLTTAEG